MGKKRALDQYNQPTNVKLPPQYWCYYCDTRHEDEYKLIQHQRSKHFLCRLCDPKAYGRNCLSLSGLVSHVRRSHRTELTEVPGAIEGRTSLDVEVSAMNGIPDDALDTFEEKLAFERLAMNKRDPAQQPQTLMAQLSTRAATEAAKAQAANTAYEDQELGQEAMLEEVMQAEPPSQNRGRKHMVGVYDQDTEAKLDRWVQAKREKDYDVADSIRYELRASGVDPDRSRPSDKEFNPDEPAEEPPEDPMLTGLSEMSSRLANQLSQHWRVVGKPARGGGAQSQLGIELGATEVTAPPQKEVMAFDPSLLAKRLEAAAKGQVPEEAERPQQVTGHAQGLNAIARIEEKLRRDSESKRHELQPPIPKKTLSMAFLPRFKPQAPDEPKVSNTDKTAVVGLAGLAAQAAASAAAAAAAAKAARALLPSKVKTASGLRTKLVAMNPGALLKYAIDVGVSADELFAVSKEAIVELILELEAQESWITVNFKPGKIGLTCEDWKYGMVKKVTKGEQAAYCGIKPGYVFVTVDGEKFDKSLVKNGIAGTGDYKIIFATVPIAARLKPGKPEPEEYSYYSEEEAEEQPEPQARIEEEEEQPRPQRGSRHAEKAHDGRSTRQHREREPVDAGYEEEDEVRAAAHLSIREEGKRKGLEDGGVEDLLAAERKRRKRARDDERVREDVPSGDTRRGEEAYNPEGGDARRGEGRRRERQTEPRGSERRRGRREYAEGADEDLYEEVEPRRGRRERHGEARRGHQAREDPYDPEAMYDPEEVLA